jgi:hypothetical protein
MIEQSTNPLLSNIVLEYSNLENQVRKLLTGFCTPFCSQCKKCCCKEKFCNESLDSFWLNKVWQSSGYILSQYDTDLGWLTDSGCRLNVGRSPVCYNFLCEDILENLSKSEHGKTWLNIAKIIPQVGRNVIGKKHLVTLSAPEVSNQLDLNKLHKHIAEYFDLLELYKKELYSA